MSCSSYNILRIQKLRANWLDLDKAAQAENPQPCLQILRFSLLALKALNHSDACNL